MYDDDLGDATTNVHKTDRSYHHAGGNDYVEVVHLANGWVHTRIVHSEDSTPKNFTPIYHAIFACEASDLPGVLEKAQSRDHGLWGANSDY